MYLFGLHIVDVAIVVACLVGILAIGAWVSRGVKKETDFYLGGRKLGKPLQFFLTFGNMTDSNGAPTTASEVFRQGAGGIWFSLQTLFITPFFWFTAVWFRRIRLVTMADLFVDRFNSRTLATAYALFNIFIALLGLGLGNVASYKVASAMIVKPASEYTQQERQSVDGFSEYSRLKAQYVADQLPAEQKARYLQLDSQCKKGELQSFVSYLEPRSFFVAYTLIVCIYITLGGLKAAAVTDAFQGLLILAFTIVMIPLGLAKAGGLSGLHAAVPEHMFKLLGTVTTSEYTWYVILAIFFTSLIQIFGLMGNMSGAGSARNESAARFGGITGGFTKRLVIIAWMLCGLIAVAMFSQGLSDPDNAWGTLAKSLLGPGLMGLFISGMLMGHMPAVGNMSISVAALIMRNAYEPLIKGRSQKHYLRAGQLAVALVLAASVLVALPFSKGGTSGVKDLMTTLITFNAFFGAAVILIFFWRKLTARAIMLSLAIWIVLIGIVPFAVPRIEFLRRNDRLLVQTAEQHVKVFTAATRDDVSAGRAERIGQSIAKDQVIPPVSVFFDAVVPVNIDGAAVAATTAPSATSAPAPCKSGASEGTGRFNVEAYALSLLGAPVSNFSKAGLVATRWGFDGVFPFVMLIVFSHLTRLGRRSSADEQLRIDRFFVRLKTPVGATAEQEQQEIALSYDNPRRFDHLKLLPRTSWEFTKWTRTDALGFGACWLIVLAILGGLWMLLNLGY